MDNATAVGPPEAENPEYWKLLEDATELDKRWKLLNDGLNLFRPRGLFHVRGKKELQKAQSPYSQLQRDTNEWLSRAEAFFVKHPPFFYNHQDKTLNALWSQREIDHKMNSLIINKFINHYIIIRHMDKIDTRRAFSIAIGSFVLALLAFAVSFLL